MAALGGEVGRESAAVKDALSEGVRRMIDALAGGMPGGPRERRAEAVRYLCALVGAVTLARAIEPALAGEVLQAVHDAMSG